MFKRLLNKIFKNNVEEQKQEIIMMENPIIEFVLAELIEGIYDKDNEFFWNHHGCDKDNYIRLAERSEILYKKYLDGKDIESIKKDFECNDISGAYLSERQIIKVYKYGNRYILVDDGRHRVAAAQELKLYIPVKIIGEYKI